MDSEFELALRLPGAADGPLELARVGDDLAVTVGGVRRLVALPSVLRRCTVTAARLDGDDLCVVFAPDPAVVDPMTDPWVRRARRGVGRAARPRAHALDRVEPVLDRLRIEPPTADGAETCAACPLCAVMAALRGERPELAAAAGRARWAGCVTLLRSALDEPAEPPPAEPHRAGQPDSVGAADTGRAAPRTGGGR